MYKKIDDYLIVIWYFWFFNWWMGLCMVFVGFVFLFFVVSLILFILGIDVVLVGFVFVFVFDFFSVIIWIICLYFNIEFNMNVVE